MPVYLVTEYTTMSALSKYTPELRSVIERPQSKVGRTIYIFLLSLITLVVLLSFVIESPDMIIAEAKVSSIKPPVILKAKTIGQIHIVVDSVPAFVQEGQYIAVIGNAANYLEVQSLKHSLNNLQPNDYNRCFEHNYMNLGELSSSYSSFKNSVTKHKQIINKENEYFRKIELYSQRLQYDLKELAAIKSSYKNSLSQFEIKKKQHKTDSILFIKNAITENQYEESCLNYLNSQRYLLSSQTEILIKARSIDENKLQIKNLKQEYSDELEKSTIEIESLYKNLLTQIKIWEDNYVLKAEHKCIVELASIINEGDFVEIGEPVFNCVFPNNRPYAVAILPSEMSGKVKVGQDVNLKLDSFPYSEFGLIKGKVDRISLNFIGNRGYLLYISLPNGLISTTGNSLFFAETVYAKAEIITEKRKLITKIYHKIYNIFHGEKEIGRKDEDNTNNETLNFRP